jgi:hypothetical protein
MKLTVRTSGVGDGEGAATVGGFSDAVGVTAGVDVMVGARVALEVGVALGVAVSVGEGVPAPSSPWQARATTARLLANSATARTLIGRDTPTKATASWRTRRLR